MCVSSQGWQQDSPAISGNVWALDNVYLGEGGPWLCSGHGSCSQGKCVLVVNVSNRTAPLSVVISGPWIMYTWVKVVHGYVQVMDHVTKESVCK